MRYKVAPTRWLLPALIVIGLMGGLSNCAVYMKADPEYKKQLNEIPLPRIFANQNQFGQFDIGSVSELYRGISRAELHSEFFGPSASFNLEYGSDTVLVDVYRLHKSTTVRTSGNAQGGTTTTEAAYYSNYYLFYRGELLWEWGRYETLSKLDDPALIALAEKSAMIMEDLGTKAGVKHNRRIVGIYCGSLILMLALIITAMNSM